LDFKECLNKIYKSGHHYARNTEIYAALHESNALPPNTTAFRIPLSRFERLRSHSADGKMYDIVVVSNTVVEEAGIASRLSK
jgi:hypothetical protein